MVIVGSILLAFGIDAAWDGRAQKERREALIAAIGSDMARARQEVDRVDGFHVDASLFDLSWFDVPWETGPTGVATLLESPRFRGMVSMMWYKYTNTTGSLDKIREAITRIEGLLPAS